MPIAVPADSATLSLRAPLSFAPAYQVVVWGGQKMATYRDDVPSGPVGESWDLADQARGMSVVRGGPWNGTTLRDLTALRGKDLVGDDFPGGLFPLLVKLIDASDRLSVQVHPDDELAAKMGLGSNGKTECWLMVGAGGELFQGTRPGVNRQEFESALAQGRVQETLNRYATNDGDFFFLQARTVHALGRNCLLYEVQQTSDITFRVWDWGRVGLDGKPRPLHIEESLDTIDFSRDGFGPVSSNLQAHASGGLVRPLADCAYFQVEERVLASRDDGTSFFCTGPRVCSVLTCLEGQGEICTEGGALMLSAMQTVLVPAAAGGWQAKAAKSPFKLMHTVPKLAVAAP